MLKAILLFFIITRISVLKSEPSSTTEDPHAGHAYDVLPSSSSPLVINPNSAEHTQLMKDYQDALKEINILDVDCNKEVLRLKGEFKTAMAKHDHIKSTDIIASLKIFKSSPPGTNPCEKNAAESLSRASSSNGWRFILFVSIVFGVNI